MSAIPILTGLGVFIIIVFVVWFFWYFITLPQSYDKTEKQSYEEFEADWKKYM